MLKIDLIQKRNFGDMITVTFNFIKQEFGSLLRHFAILCLPLVILELILKTTYMSDFLMNTVNPLDGSAMGGVVWNLAGTMILTFWVQLFTLSYIRVYLDKQRQPESERITLAEILQVMFRKLGINLVWYVCYMVMIVLATCFLIVPGIYLGVGLMFTVYYIVLKDQSLGKMFKSLELIRGYWWSTFGYVLVLSLIVNVMSYVFSAPLMVTTMMTVITGDTPGTYETALLLLLSSVGQYTLMVVMFIGISMNFFSLLDKQEHTSVLDKIDQLGTIEERAVNEGER